jgi:hypothetical protein
MSDLIIKINGLPELLNNISQLSNAIQDEVTGEILDTVFKISGKQKRKAPIDQGGLRRGIGFQERKTKDRVFFELFSNSEISAYQEFGTRLRVRVPAGLEQIANEARGSGIRTSLTAKQAIYAWCQRLGIEKRAWYPIFITLMTVGIIPKQFFFQPFFDEERLLLEKIERIINEDRNL